MELVTILLSFCLVTTLTTTIESQRRRRMRRFRVSSWQRSQVGLNSPVTISNVGKWQDGVIYYHIANSLNQYENIIQQAFQQIESRTCIQFESRQNQRDFILIVNGNGCHSKVGRTGGRQILSLGEGCHDVGSAIHELCHAIGLYHEHMRYDRDQYLSINWRNIEPSMYGQFQKVPVTQYRPAADFDYNSIMIYGSSAFSRNQRLTMLPRTRGAKLRDSHYKRTLSRGDILNINTLYSCLA